MQNWAPKSILHVLNPENYEQLLMPDMDARIHCGLRLAFGRNGSRLSWLSLFLAASATPTHAAGRDTRQLSKHGKHDAHEGRNASTIIAASSKRFFHRAPLKS